jgi:hypothetical protein
MAAGARVMMATGTLRLDSRAPEPWRYRGDIHLPSGRTCLLDARVANDDAGKFFEVRIGLQPGMNSIELEVALVEIETNRARVARTEFEQSDELPF